MIQGLGIDLGGTRIKLGAVDAQGLHGALTIEATSPTRGVTEVIDQLAALARPWIEAHGPLPIGLAIPGLVDVQSGTLVTSPNFPQWSNVPIAEEMSTRLATEVRVLNDATAAIWGEARCGAAQGSPNVAGFTLGTGVGGGLVLDGRLRHGARGMAAEFGHLVVEPSGRPCGCGGRGCLETVLGADALRGRLMEAGGSWQARADDPDVIPALFEAARSKEPEAVELLAGAGRALGYAIAAVALVVDLDRVVLMGGLAAGHDLLIAWAREGLAARIYSDMAHRITLVPGALGDASGVVGAALWADGSGS